MGMLSAHGQLDALARDSQGLQLLTRSQQNMLNTSKWWDQVWTSMLTGEGNTLSYQGMYGFLLPFLLVLMLGFLARAGFDYFKGDFMQGFTRSVLPIIFLSMFLLGYGIGSKAVAQATRQMMIRGTDFVIQAQIVEVKFKEAIEDQLYSLEFRQDLAAAAEYCRSLPTPILKAEGGSEPNPDGIATPLEARTYDTLSCMQSLLANVRARKAAIQQSCPTCKTAQEVATKAERGLQGQIENYLDLFVEGLGSRDVPEQYLDAFLTEKLQVDGPLIAQYWFVSGQEFMLFLSAYLAPIFILYASLPLPGQLGIPFTYFTSFLLIALTRLAYVFIVGVGASFLSSNPPNDGAEYWAQFLGYYAPAMSVAAVTGGAIAAVHAWNGSIAATVAAGASLISSGFGSAVSSFQQRDLRNR